MIEVTRDTTDEQRKNFHTGFASRQARRRRLAYTASEWQIEAPVAWSFAVFAALARQIGGQ